VSIRQHPSTATPRRSRAILAASLLSPPPILLNPRHFLSLFSPLLFFRGAPRWSGRRSLKPISGGRLGALYGLSRRARPILLLLSTGVWPLCAIGGSLARWSAPKPLPAGRTALHNLVRCRGKLV